MMTLAAFRAAIEGRVMVMETILAEVYAGHCAGRTGYVLFDGGAHRAYHTLHMLALSECRQVYAVEADPFMAETCREILEAKVPDDAGRVTLVIKALQDSAEVTTITWKSSPSHAGRSSIASAHADRPTIWGENPEMQYRDDMTVPATTIDLILQDEYRPLPFLKLDLEGADLLALRGAEDTLRYKRPVIAFENSIHAPKVHGFTIEQMAAYFEDLGYVPMNIVGEPIGPENWFGFFEAWAVPREHVRQHRTLLAAAMATHLT